MKRKGIGELRPGEPAALVRFMNRRKHEMIKHRTPAEQAVRAALQRNKIRHRAQYRVGPYLVDLLCIDYCLCIEVDGGSHASPLQRKLDAERDAFLESFGYQVIRISNENADSFDIARYVAELPKRPSDEWKHLRKKAAPFTETQSRRVRYLKNSYTG